MYSVVMSKASVWSSSTKKTTVQIRGQQVELAECGYRRDLLAHMSERSGLEIQYGAIPLRRLDGQLVAWLKRRASLFFGVAKEGVQWLDAYEDGRHVKGEEFLRRVGLTVRPGKQLQKRLRGLFRPMPHAREGELRVVICPELREVAGDGAFIIHPRILDEMKVKALRGSGVYTDQWNHIKGHWVRGDRDRMDALNADILIPPGSIKKEVRLEFGWLAVSPVHHDDDDGTVDIQTTVNQLSFLRPHLEEQLPVPTVKFLKAVRDSEIELGDSDWFVAKFAAEGYDPMSFPGLVKAMAQSYRKRLESQNRKVRFPDSSIRLYILPDSFLPFVENPPCQRVRRGHFFLEPSRSTFWVNAVESELDSTKVNTGTHDNDDAFRILAFQWKGETFVLATRNPNDKGQFWLGRPEQGSWLPDELPELDPSLLGKPKAEMGLKTLAPIPPKVTNNILVDLLPIPEDMRLAEVNRAAMSLGIAANAQMIEVAIFCDPMEPVADLSALVDDPEAYGDRPIQNAREHLMEIVEAGIALPVSLKRRALGILPPELREVAQFGVYPIDELQELRAKHIAEFDATVIELAKRVMLPDELLREDILSYVPIARDLYRLRGEIWTELLEEPMPEGLDDEELRAWHRDRRQMVNNAILAELSRWGEEHRSPILLALAKYIYWDATRDDAGVPKDSILFQPGTRDEDGEYVPGIADYFLQALVEARSGKVWPAAFQTVQATGVWYGLYLNAGGENVGMSKVDPETRKQYQALAAEIDWEGAEFIVLDGWIEQDGLRLARIRGLEDGIYRVVRYRHVREGNVELTLRTL